MRYSALCDVEVRGDVGVGHGDLVAEAVGGQRDDLQLHLLVALRVLALEIGVGHRHPVGQRGAQLVEDQAAPQAVLELARGHRRVLALEQLLVARLADELAVLLQAGDREDLLRELVVADANALALGFDERHLLVDHLRQDLLIDARAAAAACSLMLPPNWLRYAWICEMYRCWNSPAVSSRPSTSATTSPGAAPVPVGPVLTKSGM